MALSMASFRSGGFFFLLFRDAIRVSLAVPQSVCALWANTSQGVEPKRLRARGMSSCDIEIICHQNSTVKDLRC
jgi:hypothetical protein